MPLEEPIQGQEKQQAVHHVLQCPSLRSLESIENIDATTDVCVFIAFAPQFS
jgi:hypothetical protein